MAKDKKNTQKVIKTPQGEQNDELRELGLSSRESITRSISMVGEEDNLRINGTHADNSILGTNNGEMVEESIQREDEESHQIGEVCHKRSTQIVKHGKKSLEKLLNETKI